MKDETNDMPADVDFSMGVRGKYAGKVTLKPLYVLLEDDVRDVFQTSEQVNAALRLLMQTARTATAEDWRKAS